jgi:EAL domain-containing protein (putative c-di-GMP-specific phosphodiesterase class I)
LSNNTIDDAKFIQWLDSSIQQSGVNGRTLVLEITESSAERYFETVRPLRAQLVRLKCGFALSDFASTEQTTHLLENLKPDLIKLDTDSIEKLGRSRNEDALKRLSTLTQTAQKNGAMLIADNVSTPQQMAGIWQYGASMAQGAVVHDPAEKMNFDFSEFLG